MSKFRLICPKCEAQYEVPLQVIPAKGRDVQCSNCGNTWFQAHPDQLEAAPPQAPPPPPAEPVRDRPKAEKPANGEAAATPRRVTARQAQAPEADSPPDPPRRRLDPQVAEVLREEAEREARMRGTAKSTLESQPDLGLDTPSENETTRRRREARDRMARLRGEENAHARRAAPDTVLGGDPVRPAPSRRAAFPDVDEVNQTLRRSDAPQGPEGDVVGSVEPYPQQTRRGSGFSGGFLSVLGLAGAAGGLYGFAPQLAEQIPQAAPYLETYTDGVDQGRVWLDGQITALLTQLDQLSSEAPAATPENQGDSTQNGPTPPGSAENAQDG